MIEAKTLTLSNVSLVAWRIINRRMSKGCKFLDFYHPGTVTTTAEGAMLWRYKREQPILTPWEIHSKATSGKQNHKKNFKGRQEWHTIMFTELWILLHIYIFSKQIFPHFFFTVTEVSTNVMTEPNINITEEENDRIISFMIVLTKIQVG